MVKDLTTSMVSQHGTIRNLEIHVGQLARAMNERHTRALLSDTIPNPKDGIEHIKAITLRSGLAYDPPPMPDTQKTTPKVKKNQGDNEEASDAKVPENWKKKEKLSFEEEVIRKHFNFPDHRPPPPFPPRLNKEQLDKGMMKFFKTLKKLQLNMPFLKVLNQMLNYAKFLKDLSSKKKKLIDWKTIVLSEECSAVLQKKLPPKLKDPGSFTIPCEIGKKKINKALCDLRASINLRPLSIFQNLETKDILKPTNITLRLADRSLTYPCGIMEDVLVKVGIISVDFVVLNMEEDKDVPIILGRPFWATGDAMIEVKNGQLTLQVDGEEERFNVYKSMEPPDGTSQCFSINILNDNVGNGCRSQSRLDPLEKTPPHSRVLVEHVKDVHRQLTQHQGKRHKKKRRNEQNERKDLSTQFERLQFHDFEEVKLAKERHQLQGDTHKSYLEPSRLVLLFDARNKHLRRKKLHWLGPFWISRVLFNGAVEIVDLHTGEKFLVNSQRVAPYFRDYPGDVEGISMPSNAWT